MISMIELDWFKSSYSSSSNGETCVEIATTPNTVHVRDSKDLTGPRLTFGPAVWAGFVVFSRGEH